MLSNSIVVFDFGDQFGEEALKTEAKLYPF
jgi:hypothetical protein